MSLCVRVIPTLLLAGNQLVKGVGFDSWRRVGSPRQAMNLFAARKVDEMILLDIEAGPRGREPDYEQVKALAGEFFMPISVGGGIRTVDHVWNLLRAGANKVCVGAAAVETPDLISEIADRFGRQALTAAIDAKPRAGGYEAWISSGARATGLDAAVLAKDCARLGAGEILLTNIDRDGTMKGYDLELIRQVALAVSVPIIASGGCGRAEHAVSAMEAGASAVAVGAAFQFTELTPLSVKKELANAGHPVRM